MSGEAGRPLRLTASLMGVGQAPVLVLGNSLGTSRAVWEPQLPALAARFRLLQFDLPGHGMKVWHTKLGGTGAPPAQARLSPPGPYTIAELGSAVLALLDEFGVGRAAYAGISIGGMIGLWLAANAPGRIAALGLCCTSAYLPPAGNWLARAALVRAEGMAPVTEQAIGRWFTPPFVRSAPPAVATVRAMLEGTDPEGYAGCCEAIAAMDLRPALGAITAPTLVIAGHEDPATPPGHGALIARRIPGAKLVVVRGAAHLANIQSPGPVTAALLAHLTAA